MRLRLGGFLAAGLMLLVVGCGGGSHTLIGTLFLTEGYDRTDGHGGPTGNLAAPRGAAAASRRRRLSPAV
jgi:hypothetical protein